MTHPIAILSSDWHLRTTVPVSRKEPDWFEVMGKRMDYLIGLSNKHGGIPITVAGDVFDRPDPPASLVSWCLERMPSIIAIPGQHDLPQHRLDARMHGAWGAMVKAGTLTDITGKGWHIDRDVGIAIWGMPWGDYEMPMAYPTDLPLLCLMHKYAWLDEKSKHFGAEDDSRVTGLSHMANKFAGICIGDNHVAWRAGRFFNHGSLFSMTSAQVDFEPRVGLFWSDGTITREPCTETKEWQDTVLEVARETQKSGLITELENLDMDNISFESLISVLENKCESRTKTIIRELRQDVFR
jgi:hypothetical protein